MNQNMIDVLARKGVTPEDLIDWDIDDVDLALKGPMTQDWFGLAQRYAQSGQREKLTKIGNYYLSREGGEPADIQSALAFLAGYGTFDELQIALEKGEAHVEKSMHPIIVEVAETFQSQGYSRQAIPFFAFVQDAASLSDIGASELEAGHLDNARDAYLAARNPQGLAGVARDLKFEGFERADRVHYRLNDLLPLEAAAKEISAITALSALGNGAMRDGFYIDALRLFAAADNQVGYQEAIEAHALWRDDKIAQGDDSLKIFQDSGAPSLLVDAAYYYEEAAHRDGLFAVAEEYLAIDRLWDAARIYDRTQELDKQRPILDEMIKRGQLDQVAEFLAGDARQEFSGHNPNQSTDLFRDLGMAYLRGGDITSATYFLSSIGEHLPRISDAKQIQG